MMLPTWAWTVVAEALRGGSPTRLEGWPLAPRLCLLQGSPLEFTCSGLLSLPPGLGSTGYLVPDKVVSTDLPSGGTCSL